MNYLSYERFQELGGSEMEPSEFLKAQRQAGRMIDLYTFDRIDLSSADDRDRMEMCITDMIDVMQDDSVQIAKSGDVTKESVGSQSVEYQSHSVKDAEAFEEHKKEKLYEIIKSYFLMTGYMYRGG